MEQLKKSEAMSNWDLIRQALDESLPEDLRSPTFFIEQLKPTFLTGQMTCWMRKEDGEVATIVITTLQDDFILKSRSLCIFAAKSFLPSTDESRKSMFKILAEYALNMGCRCICAFSNNEKIDDYAGDFGAMRQTFYMFNLAKWYSEHADD